MAVAVDGIHDHYCKKCDTDCADDTEYMVHQLTSEKHIVCPVCGQEFKSDGGRDRHVGISHRQQQRLKCPGCPQIFGSAAEMMGHIEKNQCRVIKREDFQKHKAEMEIDKDHASEIMGGAYQGNVSVNNSISASYSDQDRDHFGGASLVEDQRIHNPTSWGSTVNSNVNFFDHQQQDLTEAMSELAVDKYPPLIAERERSVVSTRNASNRRYQLEDDSDGDMGRGSGHRSSQGRRRTKASAWSNNSDGANRVWQGPNPISRERPSSGNLLDSMMDDNHSTTTSAATSGTRAAGSVRSDLVPPSVRAENEDPNAPHAQVKTAPRLSLPTRYNLENYWNTVLGCYVCPGQNCGWKLKSIQEFEAHLLSGVHAQTRVKCPCCFKAFKSTTALVAHAESGSTRCDLRKTEDFDHAIRQITGGLLKVEGTWEAAGNARFKSVPVEEWNNPGFW